VPRPQQLHTDISDLATMYHHSFGISLPPLNHGLLLYRYIEDLALPLEVFSATRRLAQMIDSDFHYVSSKDARRRKGSAFPELQLISLLVITVKLLYPCDGITRHARSTQEPAAQKMSWKTWQAVRQNLDIQPPGSGIAPGKLVDVHESDVFNMSRPEIDSYMRWFQKTWVREPRPGTEDSLHREIVNMFPLQSPDPTLEQSSRQRERQRSKIITQNAQATSKSIRFQQPVTDQEAKDQQIRVKRPGESYAIFRKEEDLSKSARAFLVGASEVACTTIGDLLIAVGQVEARVARWKRARRRTERFDEEAEPESEPSRPGSGASDDDDSVLDQESDGFE
jgi:RNA polymerase I-specific transcription initiation factor RRN7